MDAGGNGDLGCGNGGGGGLLDCSSLGNFTALPADEVLGMTTGSEHWNRVHSSFNSGWTPLIGSITHSNMEVGTSPFSSFGSGTFPDMDSFLILQRCRYSSCSGDNPPERSGDKNEKALTTQCAADDFAKSQGGEGTIKPSLDGNKRRRASDDWSQITQFEVGSSFSFSDLSQTMSGSSSFLFWFFQFFLVLCALGYENRERPMHGRGR